MAAGEDQAQPLVGDRAHGLLRLRVRVLVLVSLERLEPRDRLGVAGEPPVAPQAVDRAVARRRDDPGGRVGRNAVARPALERDRKGVLDRLLGAVEVPERAGEDGDRLSRLAPEQAVEDSEVRPQTLSAAAPDGAKTMIGRTSTLPVAAPGIFAAHLIASSTSATSTT